MAEITVMDMRANSVSRRHNRRLALPLRAIIAALPPLVAISLFAGTVEVTHAPERARAVAHSLSEDVRWLKTHPPLPDISYPEPAPYVTTDEYDIYADLAAAKSDKRPRPFIEGVVALSITDVLAHDGLPTFGLPDPRLVTTSTNTQFVVLHNSLGSVTDRDLTYIAMNDVLLCPNSDVLPKVVNRQGEVGRVSYDTTSLVDACQVSITVAALNRNTQDAALTS